MAFKALITVTLKKSVLDPQGAAVKSGLFTMGYDRVRDVRIGKHMEIEMDGCASMEEAAALVDEICRKLLANPVIEEYTFEVIDLAQAEVPAE